MHDMEGENGAVLLEYVVLMLVFTSLMMAWSSMIYTTQWGFGVFGIEIVEAYQRIMAGLSLPTP